MARWELLSADVAREIWDDALVRCEGYSSFQTHAWGEFQRALGWEPCRWAAFDEQGKIVAMMQGLLRRYPLKFGIIWSEGGPVGDMSACDESLHEAIKQTTGLKRVYCRFRCDRQRQVEDALRLSVQGWRRSWFTLTTSYSVTLDLSKLLAGCDGNWRRNLKRADQFNLTVRQWTDPSVDEIASAYSSMQSFKGLDEQYSSEEIKSLLETLKQQLIIYRCDDERGELVSLRGWLVLGNRATELLSATTKRGRELRAGYAVTLALVRHCQENNIQSCDLGGIEPLVNPGVYRFKIGTGAVPIEYLGEWDWASRAWLQWFGNWAISRRARLKHAESFINSSAAARASTPETTNPGIPEQLPQSKAAQSSGSSWAWSDG